MRLPIDTIIKSSRRTVVSSYRSCISRKVIVVHFSQKHFSSTTAAAAVSQNDKPIRIGCASGFWGDTPTAVAQLVRGGKLDYLMLDYLSEITMSLLVAARQKNPDLGWCPDFAQSITHLLPAVKKQGLKIITNAGGVNPASCMKTICELAEKSNTNFKIALVTGDDVLDSKNKLTQEQCPNPAAVTSASAYLGAGPISRALDLGAEIVITGRCTDSALALGPLAQHFKWPWDDFNKMATGSLGGHLIECGAQSTGGIFTNWDNMRSGTFQDGWRCIGVCPIIGPKAREKGHKTVEAILNRCRGIFQFLNMSDFTKTYVQILGTEEAYGANARKENLETRDAVMWFGVQHSERRALAVVTILIFTKEIASAGTGMAPGLTAVIGGRPKPAPLLRFFSYLTRKDELPITIKLSDGYEEIYKPPSIASPLTSLENLKQYSDSLKNKDSTRNEQVASGSNVYKLSDDKGDNCNIGVIARDSSYFPYLLSSLTTERISKYFAHKFTTNSPIVRRYELPGVCGINFVLENSLGGGGIASLTADPQGKGYGQMLADITIENVPKLK